MLLMDPARTPQTFQIITHLGQTSIQTGEGFLCLLNFPIPWCPPTTHTVIVRKFFLVRDRHSFCFCASFLLLGGSVLS